MNLTVWKHTHMRVDVQSSVLTLVLTVRVSEKTPGAIVLLLIHVCSITPLSMQSSTTGTVEM